MPSFYEYSIWIGQTILQVFVVGLALKWGNPRRFWDVYLYLGLIGSVSVFRALVLHSFGFTSSQYAYAYYYSDTLLTLCMFVVVLRLCGHVFPFRRRNAIPMHPVWLLLPAAIFFACGVAEQSQTRLMTHFMWELGQDLYIASFVLIAILWISALLKKLRATAEVKLVWVFLIYFAMLMAGFISRRITLHAEFVVPQMAGLWLVVGVAFATITDDSRYAI